MKIKLQHQHFNRLEINDEQNKHEHYVKYKKSLGNVDSLSISIHVIEMLKLLLKVGRIILNRPKM